MTLEGETSTRQGDNFMMRRLGESHLQHVRKTVDDWTVLPAIPCDMFFASNTTCYACVKRTATDDQLANPDWGNHIGVPLRREWLFHILRTLDSSADRWYIVSDAARATDPITAEFARVGVNHISSADGAWLAFCADPHSLTVDVFQRLLAHGYSHDCVIIVGTLTRQNDTDVSEPRARPADKVCIDGIARISAIAVSAYDDESFIVAASDSFFERLLAIHPEWR